MEPSDAELLNEFRGGGPRAQVAFAAIVSRHLDLVYSVARRHVRSAQLAEEVAQGVFIDLSRGAARLDPAMPLVAWLHLVSRRTAIDLVRREARRIARETTAAELNSMQTPPPDWRQVEPLLDAAVESLPPPDRTAILLRFLENKSLRDVGAALGVSDDTAQKRVGRALDQLRVFFVRRGVTVTAAGLGNTLSAHALHTAPLGLGASITAAAAGALSSATSVGVTTLAMTTLQKTLATAVLTAALGGVIFETTQLHAQRAELATVRAENDWLAQQLRLVPARLATSAAPAARVIAAAPPVDPAQAALEEQMLKWLAGIGQLQGFRRTRPELAIPEMALLSDNDWFDVARDAKFGTEDEIRDALARVRRTAEGKFSTQLRLALGRYIAAHEGSLPDNVGQLAEHFDSRPPAGALQRYAMLANGKLADLPRTQNMLMELYAPVDWTRDTAYQFNLNGSSSTSALSRAVTEASAAFAKANNGRRATRAEDLASFLPAGIELSKVQSHLTSVAAPRP